LGSGRGTGEALHLLAKVLWVMVLDLGKSGYRHIGVNHSFCLPWRGVPHPNSKLLESHEERNPNRKGHPKDTCRLFENIMAVETGLLHPGDLPHTCLPMPREKEQKGTGLRFSKGGAQGKPPVIKIERRIKKKVLASPRGADRSNFTSSRERCRVSV